MGGHGYHGGGSQGQEGEQGFPGPVGVSSSISQEERLEIVAESDGDDWEVSAESKHGKECKENVKRKQEPRI